MINRHELVNRHNPKLKQVNLESPLTVGNGEFAFTVDVTGLQTLYDEHANKYVPLCTMSQWGWHTTPDNGNTYTLKDLIMTEYESNGRKVNYAVEKKPGNEIIYDWLRINPHRLNLGRIGFYWDGKSVDNNSITDINQELNLYEGRIESSFKIYGEQVHVETICHHNKDVLGFKIDSPALSKGKLTVKIEFPYGSHDITASNWDSIDAHQTITLEEFDNHLLLQRVLDNDEYYVTIHTETKVNKNIKSHCIEISALEDSLVFSVKFSKEKKDFNLSVKEIRFSSINGWREFWENGAMVLLHDSKDERADELERRIILSLYLLAIQSCGSMPPQETGLTCNSWYGKFHLEMYPWHCAFLPLWGRSELLLKSLNWYVDHLPRAKENAKRNGYKGARWPKMVAYDGVDSPSIIATLLIWQQPHIIYMLELCYQSEKNVEMLHQYWEVIKETAEFICDFVVWNEHTNRYDIPSPLIPAQEEHDPRITFNPTFELEYWHFTLKIAHDWSKRIGKEVKVWKYISDNMAELPLHDELYLAHENCKDTFEKFAKDHPSMLGAFGLIPGERVKPINMKMTIDKVLECWDFNSMWGWDFALMAMTYVRLGDAKGAMDILLMDTAKNSYVESGNNFQRLRNDLPLYLPGNGSLLLAVAMMTAGYASSNKKAPGIPEDGSWKVEFEGMKPFPY
jgi:hypothetical protein